MCDLRHIQVGQADFFALCCGLAARVIGRCRCLHRRNGLGRQKTGQTFSLAPNVTQLRQVLFETDDRSSPAVRVGGVLWRFNRLDHQQVVPASYAIGWTITV
jgi:hypothetical protein